MLILSPAHIICSMLYPVSTKLRSLPVSDCNDVSKLRVSYLDAP